MLFYCLKCRKNTESKNPKIVKAKSERVMLSSNCAVWGGIRSGFIKEQEARRLLSSLVIRTHFKFSQIPLVVPFFVLEVLTS